MSAIVVLLGALFALNDRLPWLPWNSADPSPDVVVACRVANERSLYSREYLEAQARGEEPDLAEANDFITRFSEASSLAADSYLRTSGQTLLLLRSAGVSPVTNETAEVWREIHDYCLHDLGIGSVVLLPVEMQHERFCGVLPLYLDSLAADYVVVGDGRIPNARLLNLRALDLRIAVGDRPEMDPVLQHGLRALGIGHLLLIEEARTSTGLSLDELAEDARATLTRCHELGYVQQADWPAELDHINEPDGFALDDTELDRILTWVLRKLEDSAP